MRPQRSCSSNSSGSCTSIATVGRKPSSQNLRKKYLLKLGFEFPVTQQLTGIKNNINSDCHPNKTHIRCLASHKVFKSTVNTITEIHTDNKDDEKVRNRQHTDNEGCSQSKNKVNTITEIHTDDKDDGKVRNRQHTDNEGCSQSKNKETPESPKFVGSVPQSSDPELEESLQLGPSRKDLSARKKTRSVSFDETVTVLTIPNKDAYSDRIKKFLWTERQEMLQNAARNTIEFASENWDWRQVADDVEFYLCPATGEKIHPCHTSYSYQQTSFHRPLHQHSFFQQNRQAALRRHQYNY